MSTIPFDRTRRFTLEADASMNCPEGWTVIKSPRGNSWRCEPPVAETVREAVADAFAEHAKPAEPEPFDVWTLSPNIMEEVIPLQQYAVTPYFPLGCVTGLVGRGKSGKSFVTLEAMLSVAAGRSFLGCPVQQGHVWYFSAEDRPDRVKERVQRILKDFSPEERARAIAHFHCINAVGKRLFFTVSIKGGPQITDVADRISALVGKAVLVVVDTVSRINQLPENANESMALVVSAGEVIADRTGAAVVLNHHISKSGVRGGETDMYAGRGGGAFGDNARSVLTLSDATEAQVATFDERTQEQQRLNNVRVLTHSAASYGREAAPLFLLRGDDGTFEKLDPVIDLLSPLTEWVWAKGLTYFTRRMLRQTHAKEIWSQTPSRTEIDRFIDLSVRTEVFLPADAGQGGGERYKLSPATPGMLCAKASEPQRAAEDAWLNGPTQGDPNG
jgi:regulatory protein RepA